MAYSSVASFERGPGPVCLGSVMYYCEHGARRAAARRPCTSDSTPPRRAANATTLWYLIPTIVFIHIYPPVSVLLVDVLTFAEKSKPRSDPDALTPM